MAVSQVVILLWVVITGGAGQVPQALGLTRKAFCTEDLGGLRLKCLTSSFSCVFEQLSWSPSACAGQMWPHRATAVDDWGEVGEFQLPEPVLDGS